MISDDFINRLPEHVLSDLFRHYIGLQLRIRFELDLLGIRVFGLDFCDDNYWLEFRFEGWGPLEEVLEIVEGVHYPSGAPWDVEDHEDDMMDAGLALFIPRMDLYVAYRMLNRLTTLMISDEQWLAKLKEHEQRRGGQTMERWGWPVQ